MVAMTSFPVAIFTVLLSVILTDSGHASKCLHRTPSGTNGTLEKVPGDNGFYLEITGEPLRYQPGATYTVKLAGRSTSADEARRFSRFVLVSGNEDVSLQAIPSSAGDFQLMGDVKTKFSDHCTNTITETTHLPKNEIQVLWTAPPTGSGCVTFKAMVVDTRNTWAMDNGRLSLSLCEDKHEEEEVNIITEPCCACTEAKYEVMFQGLWSKESHPKDFPVSEWLLHFSDVIGASHSADYRVWEAGGLASKGLSQVAKWGSPRVLESELKAKSAYIRTIIKSRGLWYPNVNGKTFAIFRTDSRNHLVSLVSMLGPSPDWIVGVSALELCTLNCTWMENKEILLYPWDAGVDSGISYESPDVPTNPQEPIQRITTSYPANPMAPFFKTGGGTMAPLAKLTIQKLREYKKSCARSGEESVQEEFQFFNPERELDAVVRGCEVTEWASWSGCSVTCGKGISSRSRDYLDSHSAIQSGCDSQLIQREMCAATIGVCQGGGSNFYESAPTDWTPDDMCATTEWSDWSECSSNCGAGFRVRTRRFYNRLGRKQCPHVETIMKQECSVGRVCDPDQIEIISPSCAVTDWSMWSPCSVSCGSGIKVRTRLYRVTREQQVAAGCSLQLMEKATCTGERQSCDWGDANAICQQEKEEGPCRGQFQRWHFDSSERRCRQFNFGGCRGNSNNFLTEEDCEKLCSSYKSDDVADDPWAYSQQTNQLNSLFNDDFTQALDVLAKQRREKESDGMNQVFMEIEEQRKVVDQLEGEKSGVGDLWSREGELMAAQKKLMMMEKQVMMKKQMEVFQIKQNMMKEARMGGQDHRGRHQGDINHRGNQQEEINHRGNQQGEIYHRGNPNATHTNSECEVTAWSPWSVQCSASCGRGYRHRFRNVSRPGRTCLKSLNRKKKCRLPPCPKDCTVSEWGDWGPCSASCGSSGAQERHRQVLSGDISCPSLLEKRVCLLSCCPGDPYC